MIPTLYYAKGTCSVASMAALELADMAYEPVEVVFAGPREAVRSVSGEGRVPVLDVGGRVISESIAILWWIACARPDKALLPTGDALVEALSIMAWLTSRVHILRRQVYRPNQFVADEGAQVLLRDAARAPYRRELGKLDALIADGCVEAPGLRAYALAFAFWAAIDGFDDLPHLKALATDLLRHPGVARAAALHRHAAHHDPK